MQLGEIFVILGRPYVLAGAVGAPRLCRVEPTPLSIHTHAFVPIAQFGRAWDPIEVLLEASRDAEAQGALAGS